MKALIGGVRASLAPLVALALFAAPARADDIELQSGETLTGKLQGERMSIETTQGRVEATFDALAAADLDGSGGVRVELVDGTTISGRLIEQEVVLRQGLVDRAVPAAAVRRLIWSPPKATIPAGTPVQLMLVRSVSSASAKAGASVSLCTADAVSIGGKVVIERFAPASGFVLGTGSGPNVGGGGTIVLRAGSVVARDGSSIPLAGNLEVRGGFEGANWGLIGLLSEGSAAVAANGLVLEAKTAGGAEVELRGGHPSPEDQASQDLCTDYFRFSGLQEIPLEQVVPGRAYAPVAQPLKLSVPLISLVRASEFASKTFAKPFSTRALSMDGVSLLMLSVEGTGKGKHGGYLDIDATVAVQPSHDRWVSLSFEVFADDKKLRSFQMQRIDAEERKMKTVRARLSLSREQTDALLHAADPRLRIMMTAIDN
jgi:hypothetical protein